MITKDSELDSLRAEIVRLRAMLHRDPEIVEPLIIARPSPKWINCKRACRLLRNFHHGEPDHRTVKRWAERDGFGFKPAGGQWRFDENRILLRIEGRAFEPLKICGDLG